MNLVDEQDTRQRISIARYEAMVGALLGRAAALGVILIAFAALLTPCTVAVSVKAALWMMP